MELDIENVVYGAEVVLYIWFEYLLNSSLVVDWLRSLINSITHTTVCVNAVDYCHVAHTFLTSHILLQCWHRVIALGQLGSVIYG